MYIYFTIFSENHEHASITKHPLLDSTVYLAPSVKHKAEGERGRSAGRKHAAVLQHMERRSTRTRARKESEASMPSHLTAGRTGAACDRSIAAATAKETQRRVTCTTSEQGR